MKHALLAISMLACTRESPPTASPEPAIASAAALAPASAPALAPAPASASASAVPSSTPSASPNAAASTSPNASDDPVALALAPTDAALHKAYARSKSSSLGGAHPGPFITPEQGRVTGDAKRGWTVSWSRHPPAGFEIEATATVSPSKQVKVTKAEVTFSPD